MRAVDATASARARLAGKVKRKSATSQRIRRTHPAIEVVMARRAADLQLKVTNRSTAFAGSMPFVHLHAAVFGAWMIVLS